MSLDWRSRNKDTMGIWNRDPLGVRPNPNPNPLTDGLTPIHTVTLSGDPVTQHSPGIHKRFTLTRVIPMTSETPVFTSIHKGDALAPEQTSQSLIPEHGIQVLQTGLPSLYVTWFKKAKYYNQGHHVHTYTPIHRKVKTYEEVCTVPPCSNTSFI